MFNKRGIVFTLPLLIIGLVVILVSSAFFFEGFRNYIFGLVLAITFVGILYTLVSKTQTTEIKAVFASVVATGVLAFFLFGGVGWIQQATYGGYIEAPYFGVVKCDRSVGGLRTFGGFDFVNNYNSGDGTIISAPQNLESYDVLIDFDKNDMSFGYWYYIIGGVCADTACNTVDQEVVKKIDNSYGLNKFIFADDVPRGKKVYVQIFRKYANIGSNQYVQQGDYFLRYQPYILFDDNRLTGGLNPISGSTDCSMPNDERKLNAILDDGNLESKNGREASEDTIPLYRNYLEPNEAYNYVSGTVTRASFGNTINYQGQDGYCADNLQGGNAKIFGITELKTLTTTYQVVDLNKVIKDLGSNGCCIENQVKLNMVCKNLKWEVIPQDPVTGQIEDVECSLTNPCNPGRFILSGQQTHEYSCISGECKVTDIQNEECTTNDHCIGFGDLVTPICVNYKCIDASTVPDLVTCDEDPTQSFCPQQIECAWYQEPTVILEKDYGILYWRWFVGNPTVTETPDCTTAGWFRWSIAGLIVLIIAISGLFIYKPKKKGGRKKK